MRGKHTLRSTRSLAVWLLLAATACASSPGAERRQTRLDPWHAQLAVRFAREPDTVPTRWRGLIGEYGPDTTILWYALERDGRMWILEQHGNYVPLAEVSDTEFEAPFSTAAVSGRVRFHRDSTGRATSVQVADFVMQRRDIEPLPGETQLRVTPVRPIEELRSEALAAEPPPTGPHRPTDLVELTRLDSTIKLDIRYAGTNNFLGARMYEEARAFLQRPAAEALVRANRAVRTLGFGLLVHDAYRPWYVTRIFWDATPEEKRWLVANPEQGSKHNRGMAVDVTLYDLATGEAMEMPSTYDESSRRAAADYPGGTASERWNRALLRTALEHEGFTVNPLEWWHFDFKEWESYPILNVPFDRIGR